MAGGEPRQFGVSSRGRQTSGVSRREAIIGGVAVLVVLAIFAVFAVISITAESEKPEIVAGTFFLPYHDLDTTSGPVGFAVIDGGPAGRLSQVPELMGQQRNNQQWVRVFNSPAGAYLVDRSSGNTTLVLPSIATASATPTVIAPPQAGIAATDGASVFGATTDQGLFVVRRARTPGGNYFGDVHLLTPSSMAGGVEVGAVELQGAIPAATLVADAAAGAGDGRFAGLGDAGRYADSLAMTATGDALWLIVETGNGGRLLRIAAPTPEAIAAFREAAASAEQGTSVPPPQLRVDDVGEVSTSAVLTPLASGGVAAADPESGTVTFFGAEGQTGRVTVDGLAGASTVLPADGGALAWFAVGSPSSGWRALGAGSSGQVRSVDLAGTQGTDIAAPVVVGSTMFTASRRDGRVFAVNLDNGNAVAVAEEGRYPLEPELDGPAGPGGGLTTFDYGAVHLERHGPRVSVDVPAASLALFLEADGSLVEVLLKGQADPIDPDATIDPNSRGDADEPPDPEQQSEETVGTQAANQEREGDSSIACEAEDSLEPRAPLLLPQGSDRAATAISPRWRYQLISSTDCLPSFRVEIRELPNGDAEQRDLARPNQSNATITGLKPSTDYAVTVIAFIGENTARSNTARYSTGPTAPLAPRNVRFSPDTSRWELLWDDGCQPGRDCDTPAVRYEVEWSDGSQIGSGSAVVAASSVLRQQVAIDDVNVGRNLCFTVVAVGANASKSDPAPSTTGACDVRERAPRNIADFVSVEASSDPSTGSRKIEIRPIGLNAESFPRVMGTRGAVRGAVTFTGLPPGWYEGPQDFVWNFADAAALATVDYPSIPVTAASSVSFALTLRNDAGSDSTAGDRIFAPASCGALPVNIRGFDRFDPGSQTWAIRFELAGNTCPGAPPLPPLVVTNPPGCGLYPANIGITCTNATLNVDSATGFAFGFRVEARAPEGYTVDGVSFVNGPYVLARPGPFARFNGKVWFQEARLDPAPANTYVVVLRNENLVTPSTLQGCTFLGSSGTSPNQSYRYRCASPEDTQMTVPRTFRITPGQALPQGPYPANQGTCADIISSSFVQVPSGIATYPSPCVIGLKKVYDPLVSTTLPPGDTCPYTPDDPEYLTDPRCVEGPPDTEPEPEAGGLLLPLGLLGASGLVLHAFADRRRGGSRRPRLDC